ncbi:MAG: hypothetical protein AAF266_04520 [Planctomycetota bacterium]
MFGKSNQGWIGVDVGGRAIKVAQLRRVRDGLQLSAASISRRAEASDEALLEDLRTAKAVAEKAKGTRVAATLSMASWLVEPLQEEAVPQPDRCVASWTAGPDSAYTLSAPRTQIETAVDGFSRVGLQCEVIDGPPLAIARVLQLTPGYRRETLLGALDWGESAVVFVAATNGEARYVRSLHAAGFAEVRRQIADKLGMSDSEADRLITEFGVSEPPIAGAEARLADEAIRDAIRPVIQELRRTLEHLGGKLKCKGPERIFVMGSAATVPGLTDAVSEAIETPTEPWSTIGVRRDDSDNAVPECLLAQAIALSALAWEPPGDES